MVNSKQQEAIKSCISMLDMWLHTNDIKSPSHYSLIDDMKFDLGELIKDETNADLIGETIADLLTIIKNLK